MFVAVSAESATFLLRNSLTETTTIMAVQVDRIEFYHDATLVAAIAVDNEKQQLVGH